MRLEAVMDGVARSVKMMDLVVMIGGRLLRLRIGGKWSRQQCGERDSRRCLHFTLQWWRNYSAFTDGP